MNAVDRISKVFASAEEIPFDDSSKIILMSDVHRGDGSWADDFNRNENLFIGALTHYDKENFTYIELGDGDELWKYKSMSEILPVHKDVFQLLNKFHDEGRLYLLYGNHDMVKSKGTPVRACFEKCYDEQKNSFTSLFRDIRFHEGLILRYEPTGSKLLLIHGHQGSIMDYTFWGLRRFLVRYVWKRLELLGFNDPTSTAKNYHKKEAIEHNLTEWVKQTKHILIAGHTHRPMFPKPGRPPYFNDGSCVHPHSITGIEIVDGCLILVKWEVKIKEDGTLYIGREVLEGPRKLTEYLVE